MIILISLALSSPARMPDEGGSEVFFLVGLVVPPPKQDSQCLFRLRWGFCKVSFLWSLRSQTTPSTLWVEQPLQLCLLPLLGSSPSVPRYPSDHWLVPLSSEPLLPLRCSSLWILAAIASDLSLPRFLSPAWIHVFDIFQARSPRSQWCWACLLPVSWESWSCTANIVNNFSFIFSSFPAFYIRA